MSEDASVGQKPASVSFFYILLLVLFSFGTSSVSFCSVQVLPFTARKFTDSTALIGFIVALQSLNQLWITPYAAWKSDRIWTRIGRRKPLVLVMAPLLVITVMLVPHCPELWMLISLVFILQMAEDAELAIMTPAIGDSVPDRQRPLATGMWRFMLAASSFLMGKYVMKLMEPGIHRIKLPFSSIGLSLHGGEHWPYTAAGLTVAITGAIFLWVMRERYVPPRPKERFRLFSYGREVYRVREHMLIYVVCFFQPLFVLVSSSFFPLLAVKQLGMSKADYGLAFSWGALITMVASFPLGFLFIRLRRRREFSVASCLCAAVPLTFGLFFMHSARDMAIFFALQQLMFIVFQLNFTPYIIEYTTPRNVATIMGFTTAVNGLVRFTMIPLIGFLVDLHGKNYRLPLWGGYLGVAVCTAALLMMRPPEKIKELLEVD